MSNLPINWSEVPIGSFARVVGGGTPPSKDPANFAMPGQGIPWLTPADLSGYRHQTIQRGARDLTEAGFAACGATLLPKGSVLFSSRAPIGYVAIAANQISTNQGFKSFVLPEGFDPRFTYYQLKHLKPEAEAIATGTTFKELSGAAAATLPFRVAPLAEQARIADQLDTLLARVNACNDRLDAIPGILKRFRQVVLNAAAGTDFLGNAPEAPLRVVQLHTVLAEPLRNGKSVRDGAGLSVLRLTSLKPSGLDLNESKAGDWSAVPDVSRFLIQNGDYLVSRGNGSKDRVGLGGLVHGCKEDLAFPDTMIRLRPDQDKLLPEYLNYVWSSQLVRQQIEHVAKTTAGIWKVSQPDLERISFPLPDLDEQLEIVSRVDGLLKLANRIEARYAAMRAHAQRLPPQVLAKAFRGELVEQDPQDEPASQLLGRLRAARANAAADRSKERPKTLGKRPIMSNADIDSIKAEIMNLESDRFSFNELKARIACDYETLKTSLFALLEEPKPVVRQVFDEECKEVQFVRVGA